MAQRNIYRFSFLLVLYSAGIRAQYENCTDGVIDSIQDGQCDDVNNNEGCGYDGGDCCSCSCINGPNYMCGVDGFSCSDPDVDDLETYVCVEIQPTPTACRGELQKQWIVENTLQARSLGEAIRCPGMSFDVIWRGEIIINETLSIYNGTVLNIVGVDIGSAIDGDGKNRLFSIVNASLKLSNITVKNGYAKYGGAIGASRSSLSFNGVNFTENNASNKGGAVFLTSSSTVSFGGESYFLNNNASDGGALFVGDSSNVLFAGNTSFLNNTASSGDGGGVSVAESSSVTWTGKSLFSSNRAGDDGGALHAADDSSAIWEASSQFLFNSAGDDGGAVYATRGSKASWSEGSSYLEDGADFSRTSTLFTADAVQTAVFFYANNATNLGGAVFVTDDSTALWSRETTFSENIAHDKGGAVYSRTRSKTEWGAKSYFFANRAQNDGGAVGVSDGNASWNREVIMLGNDAISGRGGALFISNGSYVGWTAKSVFSANRAGSNGGALYAGLSVFMSWNSTFLFSNNTAQIGGAIFVTNDVTAEWSGETSFYFNKAEFDGGAIGSRALNSELSSSTDGVRVVESKGSVITIKGPTKFVNNTCGVSGGAIALVQSLEVLLKSRDVSFLQNYAGVSGGALYIASIGVGPIFRNVTFMGNSAQTGGGVYVTGSGTTVASATSVQVNYPTTFDGCIFVDNFASATGGAVDSASGKDVFNHTQFRRNEARVGGALRLAGTAFVDSCIFDENISELGGGPAVSNIGVISGVSNSAFIDNMLTCEPHTFFEFNKTGIEYDVVCSECSICSGCSFGDEKGIPTCISLTQAGVEHASSIGGTTTLEQLNIDKGYWRATSTSTNVKECFNTEACTGGLTGSSDFCLQGYEGPYCSVCSKGYSASLSFTCRECSDETVGLIIATVLVIMACLVGFILVSYLISADGLNGGRRIIGRVTQWIPMQSVKTVIIVWQILTQFASVANVTFPNVYKKFIDGVNFLNFDLSWVLSVGCFLDVDFHDRLLWTTIAPIAIMGLLEGTYAIAVRRHGQSSQAAIRNARHKLVSMVLLVTFLVYSSASSTVFQMFACENLDDGKRYLLADYSIECDSFKHKVLQIYAGLMIIVYPVGIPALYACLLFSNRHVLLDEQNRNESPIVESTSDLWKPYKPRRFYYEVIECCRRIVLAGVVVFIYPNTAAQIAVTLAIAVAFMVVSEALAPYESQWDVWVSRIGHVVVFASMYLALLLKVDVSDENAGSQKTFEATLVAVHVCMILAVVLEAIVMAFNVRRVNKQQEDPKPRFRGRPYSIPTRLNCNT